MRPEDGVPLVPRGFGGPKFPEDAQNKFLANEDENAYVQLEVFGDPAPKAQWFRYLQTWQKADFIVTQRLWLSPSVIVVFKSNIWVQTSAGC